MAKFCTACGAELSDDKKFCTECGTAIEEEIVQQPQEQTQQQPQEQTQKQLQGQAQPYLQQRQQQQQQTYQHRIQPQQPQIPYGVETAPVPGSTYEPITTGGYIGLMLLMCIPVVGIILAIVWACGGCRKINKRNLARASLIMMAVSMVFGLIFGLIIKVTMNKVTDAIKEETGISLTEEEEGNGKGLLALLVGVSMDAEKEDDEAAGFLSDGSVDYNGVTNSDIEALEELGNVLEGLENLEKLSGDDVSDTDTEGKSLSEFVDEAQDINREAEAKNDGWPKSLREYPGGTAIATASYRTEITDTSAEEMLNWLDDLKKDGFVYQDFYDFGFTEEDMLSMNGWWGTDGEVYVSVSFDGSKVIIDRVWELPDMSGLFN